MKNPQILLSDSIGKKLLLSGNEAIARGALEAGIQVATAYPGTPSSEIIDNLTQIARKGKIYTEYSTNEKVALEVAAGASICKVRALSCMKHVGLNVASDPLITLAYTGVRGGLVIVSADDPGCWSSQNEQDNRYYSLLANLPCIEPTNSQEAKDWLIHAFNLSEKFELPVIFRTTTRVNHSLGPVTLGPLPEKKVKHGEFSADVKRFVMVPDFARVRHNVLLKKIQAIEHSNFISLFNKVIKNKGEIGIIASGISYNYAMEALENLRLRVPVLKIGFTHPFSKKYVSDYLKNLKEVFVIEELEPFLENAVRSLVSLAGLKINIHGKSNGFLPRAGELSVSIVQNELARRLKRSLTRVKIDDTNEIEKMLPKRPPILCPGCSHRASFYAIKKALGGKAISCTDIGCYALGIQEPLNVGDLLICMGASVGTACGISKVQEKPVVAFVGDSTFFHASIPGLIDAVYNNHKIVLVILDNLTTAMTGFQPHPGTENSEISSGGKRIIIEELARGCGVEYVKVVDPYRIKDAVKVIKQAQTFSGPAVVVFRQKCSLLLTREKKRKGEKNKTCKITNKCNECLACIKAFGCPALIMINEKVTIDENLCNGCTVCMQVCPFDAIELIK